MNIFDLTTLNNMLENLTARLVTLESRVEGLINEEKEIIKITRENEKLKEELNIIKNVSYNSSVIKDNEIFYLKNRNFFQRLLNKQFKP